MVFTISLFALTVVLFILLMIVSFLLYKKRNDEDFNLKNSFPFELNYHSEFKENFYTHIFIALYIIACAGFYATFHMSYNNGYLIFIMIGGVLSTLAIYALFYIPLLRLRLHIIIDAIFFALRLAISGALIIVSWRLIQKGINWANITSIVLASIATLATIAIIINPRLDLNFKLMEVVKENGETEEVRPKYVSLAFSEWLLIFLNIFNMLNIVILVIAMK